MIVHVNQQDIDQGETASCTKCPIALAVARFFPHALHVYVWSASLRIIFADAEVTFDLPDEAVKFVHDFDEELSVAPFHFTLPFSG